MQPKELIQQWVETFNQADSLKLTGKDADVGNKIKFQRSYGDKLSFLKMHNLPLKD